MPEADNRARAFPFNESTTHFVGPAVVDGKLWRVSVWINQVNGQEGRSYLRMVFEEPDEE